MAVLALLVRRDGGPVLYRQTRIGEGGQAFQILKLRSMRVGSDTGPRWSSRDDDRVTPIGSVMRRTHLDELPQLFNVIRGEMSIVGPRPEQPDVVKDLELTIPFYSRRHLVRPGITGWAQVQCGYAGSQNGSALKACYDLYYIKHRSVRLDCLVLLETVRTFVADRQWHDQSVSRAFAFAEDLHAPATSLRELSLLPEPVQDAS
jgi:lipopolysaccharide/colanic/teichoic acid biosynthesis glycosyltransferase